MGVVDAAIVHRHEEETGNAEGDRLGRQFFQVSRAAIIRLDAVKEAKPFSDGTGEIVLANGQTMIVARRRCRELLNRLEE